MCGIVGGGGGGGVDIRNKGKGRLQVGSKPGLGCHYFLGQAVPFGYGPGEE